MDIQLTWFLFARLSYSSQAYRMTKARGDDPMAKFSEKIDED
jgi:hypothetical protein